ncbi:MAG: hypothetical protein ACI4KO_09135 [Ruminiclostridium sp.]
MKKKTLAFKTMAASLAAVAAMSCTSLTAFADKIKTIDGVSYRYSDSGEKIGKFSGWAKTSKGRRYYKNGVMYKNKWIKTKGGKYYYAGADGYMRTGWARVTRGKGYYSYFDKNGVWDGKTYYRGYKPKNLHSFFLDYDFFSGDEYYYAIGNHAANNMKEFEGVDTLHEIIEKDLYTSLSKDKSISDNETELSDDIYHGGTVIVIRSSVDKNADFEFTKDSKGNSYLYSSFFEFGLKLSDSSAYDKISEFIE